MVEMNEEVKNNLVQIWNKYIEENKPVSDPRGNVLEDIDGKRIVAIQKLKLIIHDYQSSKIDLAEFKTDIDRFNKRNNLWGFTAIKGQMFFNLLLKTCENEEEIANLSEILKSSISKPSNLLDALKKIEKLEVYTSGIFHKAIDKRKVPNPSSICYFLSYFWQIHDPLLWPIMYSSMISSFKTIGIWPEIAKKSEAYSLFYQINDEIKNFLSIYTGRKIENWDAEHAFWNQRVSTPVPLIFTHLEEDITIENFAEPTSPLAESSFNIYDYLPPITSKLIEIGNDIEISPASKGRKFEIAVMEIFKQLGFTVISYGQGTGREPDLIAIHKEHNEAFIIDAKAYSNGYIMSASDERAIREYILHYCPRLQKEGIKKIGFLIISNGFKSDFENFISDITWKTDVKRFLLVTSDALLHLLAYKLKDQLNLSQIVEGLISLGNTITSTEVIEKFDDI